MVSVFHDHDRTIHTLLLSSPEMDRTEQMPDYPQTKMTLDPGWATIAPGLMLKFSLLVV
jgi:hypothetical protein